MIYNMICGHGRELIPVHPQLYLDYMGMYGRQGVKGSIQKPRTLPTKEWYRRKKHHKAQKLSRRKNRRD